MINRLINELVQYGISKHLVEEDDLVYVTNRLLELFGQMEFSEEITEERPLAEILEDMCTYAFENGMIEDDSVTVTDLFDTKIMGLLTPAPSVVRKTFYELYKTNSKLATDYYYEFSKRTNYIRIDRIAKDEKWVTETPYGPIDITINLSKMGSCYHLSCTCGNAYIQAFATRVTLWKDSTLIKTIVEVYE